MIADELERNFSAKYALGIDAYSLCNFAQSLQAIVSRYEVDIRHSSFLLDVHNPGHDVFLKCVVRHALPVDWVVLQV